MLIRVPPRWQLPESLVTPEHHWTDRRRFLRGLGLGAIGLSVLGCSRRARGGTAPSDPLKTTPPGPTRDLYPAKRNPKYPVTDRPPTPERLAVAYNNFYEFTTDKESVWRLVGDFEIRPWTVTLAGLCRRQGPVDFEKLVRAMPLEERVYRFRCVEAWSMVVPWSGFPLRKLVEYADPLPEARFVRLVTAHRPEQMPGVRSQPWYRWPFYEGLTLAEATHELAFVATGLYGHELPKQNGAPLRLVVPWKYGYKNIKSIVRVEFTRERPRTFWNDLAPHEYDFAGNVLPQVPHPRWSQATERLLGTGERVPTLPFNGYASEVASLYRKG